MTPPEVIDRQPTTQRMLQAIESTNGSKTRCLFEIDGENYRLVHLQQNVPRATRFNAGSEHALIIDLAGTPDVQRWRGQRPMGHGSARYSTTTWSAENDDIWQFARNDVLQLHISQDALSALCEDFRVGDGSSLEILDVLGMPDPVAKHLALALVQAALDGHVAKVFADTLSLAFAQLLLSRYSNLSGDPRLLRSASFQERPEDVRIARAIDFIDAHLEEELSIASIAGAACMSPSWLKSAFTATTGKPVWSYVRERRLERARLMLSDKNMSLAQIAYACGFSSHSHMSRLFKQHYGATPKEMRE